MKRILLLAFALILFACAPSTPTALSPTKFPTADVSPLPTQPVSTTLAPGASAEDLFTANGIQIPAPTCDGNPTPEQTEGPYYKPNTPQRNSLLEAGMAGTRLLIVGYVLDRDCQPAADAWLDFWQADANGDYDNAGYILRGHQFTDSQGRYFLETILPGLYESRPIRHIHVKVRPPGGAEITTQLYFPDQPVEDLTVTLEDRGEYLLALYNFILP